MSTVTMNPAAFAQGGYAVNRTRQVFLATALNFRPRLPWFGFGPGRELFAQPLGGVRGFAVKAARDTVYLDQDHRIIEIRRGRGWRLDRPCKNAAGALDLPAGAVERTQTEVGDEIAICPQA